MPIRGSDGRFQAAGIANKEGLERALRDVFTRVPRDAVGTALRKISFDVATKLIETTPVDTGGTRGAWLVSIGSPASGDPGKLDPSGESTTSAAQAVALSAPAFSVVYVSNNKPWVRVLDAGEFEPKDPSDDAVSQARRAASRSEHQKKNAELLGGPGKTFVRGGFSVKAPRGMSAVALQYVTKKYNLKGGS